jgi:hypothetical protein
VPFQNALAIAGSAVARATSSADAVRSFFILLSSLDFV